MCMCVNYWFVYYVTFVFSVTVLRVLKYTILYEILYILNVRVVCVCTYVCV